MRPLLLAGVLLAAPGCRRENWVRTDGLVGVNVGRIKAARWMDLRLDRDRQDGVGVVVLSTTELGCDDLLSGGLPWHGSHQNFMADSAGVVGLYRWFAEEGGTFEGTYVQGGYVYGEDFEGERNVSLLVYEEGMARYAAYDGGSSEVVLYSKSSVLGTFDTPFARGAFNALHCGQLEDSGYGYY